MKLLQQLCNIHAPSGNERKMKEFILEYVRAHSSKWEVKPKVIQGPHLQDNLILVFGKPRTAVFAHMDSIGFSVRYHNQLIPIGGPEAQTGYELVGEDSFGEIECKLEVDKEGSLFYQFGRAIDRGTELTFKCDFRNSKNYVQSCYLDNRLGIYCALQVASQITDGVIVFSTWEEHGGGSVPLLSKYIYEEFSISQALICDITWVTEGVRHGDGVVISLRDRNIPRKSYLERIIGLANQSEIPYQLEVEASGSSDGREVQVSPYPIDWCFIGAPEDNVHSPDEKVHKKDIQSMIDLYQYLMDCL